MNLINLIMFEIDYFKFLNYNTNTKLIIQRFDKFIFFLLVYLDKVLRKHGSVSLGDYVPKQFSY